MFQELQQSTKIFPTHELHVHRFFWSVQWTAIMLLAVSTAANIKLETFFTFPLFHQYSEVASPLCNESR